MLQHALERVAEGEACVAEVHANGAASFILAGAQLAGEADQAEGADGACQMFLGKQLCQLSGQSLGE